MTETVDNLIANEDIDPFDMLKWHLDMGADEAISDTPVNWFETKPETSIPLQSKGGATSAPQTAPSKVSDAQVQAFMDNRTSNRPTASPRPVAARPVQASTGGTPEQAEALAASCDTIEALLDAVKNFDGGHIKRSARNTVFADGVVGAPIMFIGESPGQEEDRTGKPFLGSTAGTLFDKMINAIDLDRQKNCYISNIVPWRPIGKPVASPEMIAMCLPFVKRHIELAKPKIIIALGKIASSHLLGLEGSITRYRGKWQDLSLKDQTFAAMPLYHPAYLMKATHLKKDAWHDLQSIQLKLNELEMNT
ncbi:uracil-DNA glycosylase [Temperatibacter marinus]|uniref:Type-4 uracil-DNA glycosylase n=1 Tax=Temperatibacter marinus TaxID=1456591 RepID=A0AA52EFR2_9PROT|nr:uracil-DNA glycosylase [Temperatibacter marinus]WND02005.1 uracil-DNA glycosylase [Temperatibacter marinus]